MRNPTKQQKLVETQIDNTSSFTRTSFLALLIVLFVSFMLTACSSGTKTGIVTNFGQSVPAGGGIVQSFVIVELDDGSEVTAWLPQDDQLWDAMRKAARSGTTRIEIKREGKSWEFVQVLPDIIKTEKVAEGRIITASPKSRPQTDGTSMGDPNAPVKIVEYSDFQCPPCRQFADTTEQKLVDDYVATGKVYFTYRSMGNFVSLSTGIGTESQDAAEASYCASDQGKFWEYKDILFANALGKNEGYFAIPRLKKMAKAIGLDLDQFNECLDGEKFRDRVQQDFQDGNSSGVTGVPALFINGKLFLGNEPFETFQEEIETILQASGD